MDNVSDNEFNYNKKYWLNKLIDLPITNYIEPDINEGIIDLENSNCLEFELNNSLTEKIEKIARKDDIKIFAIILSSVKTLLFNYCYRNSMDIILWTSSYADIEEGRLMCLRDKINSDITFKELIIKSLKNINDVKENMSIDIEKIIETMGFNTDKRKEELLDVGIIYKNIMPNVVGKLNKCNMLFDFNKENNIIKVNIKYKKMYSDKLISTLKDQLKIILEHYLYNIEDEISSANIISEIDRQSLLIDFNNTDTELHISSIVKSIIEQAHKTPDNTAIIFEDKRVSYKQLNDMTNKIAKLLINEGVQKNDVVALYFDRSHYSLIGMISVMKTGAAYLTLNPNDPTKRKGYMLNDSNVSIILTSNEYKDILPGNYKIYNLDNLEEDLNLEDVCVETDENSVVSIIYTSGSTGKPKGVINTYKGLCNVIGWMVKELKIKESDVALQLVAPTFDGYSSNAYPVLTLGGTTVIVSEDKLADYNHISELIKKYGITNISLVPAIYKEILNANENTGLKSIRFIQLAGDRVTEDLIKKSVSINPNILIINAYGPTENSMSTTTFIGVNSNEKILIGKPIYNTKVYVLGENKMLMPIGAPGELYISGIGLAKGYIKDKELTEEKFVRNPYYNEKTMYKTGDLVKWNGNGNLEFIQRIDTQINIRGMRIDMGEIERCLLELNEIKEAVVVNKESENKDNYLVAYVVLEDNIEFSKTKIQKHLLDLLPNYMVPAYIVPIKRVPLNYNGKVDLKNLPNIEGISKNEYVAPTTDTQKKIVDAWSEILVIDSNKISINDTFFDLGGNSISIMKLANRLNNEFNLEMQITSFFDLNTVEDISKYIDEKIGNKDNDVIKIEL